MNYLLSVVIGVAFGTVSRFVLLRTDFRQYPTYPQGRMIHLSFGFIAAFLGAVAVPSVLDSNWTAVTFLGLAATQFREVRRMERDTLEQVDLSELVKRGTPFIEGMAQAFESRNYLVMFTALVTTMLTVINLWLGILGGIAMLFVVKQNMSGNILKSIANVIEGEIRFEGPNLFVGDIHIKNVGLKVNRDIIMERAVGAIIIPKNENSVVTLSHLGQRQAMLHQVANVLGAYIDSGEPSFIPLSKRDMDDGRLALFIMPQEKDFNQVKTVLEKVPVLDSAIRLPSEGDKGKK
ncbi:YIEGIA family protein [Bacillus sp. FJAT-49732]|uniref:YIEGIA family protein n=1 Tax=Lederbergia citrisecunda TaxID=2833583 RepID=A0A942TSD7_9BACI|nr:YIEGIA family protein [Lederbergia citrisecunda]MBS4202006.1 YIEGIA family protein [Lederbergia citrisecunda]